MNGQLISAKQNLYTDKKAAQDLMSQLTKGAWSYTVVIDDKEYDVHWVEDGSLSVSDKKTHGMAQAMTRVADFFRSNEQASLLTQLNSNLNAAAKHLIDQFIHPNSYFYSWNGYHQNTLENNDFRPYKRALSGLLQGKLPEKYEPFASFIQDCITGNNSHFVSANLNLTGVLKNWKGLDHLTLINNRMVDWEAEIEKPWKVVQSKKMTSLKGLSIQVASKHPDVVLNKLLSFCSKSNLPPSFTLMGDNHSYFQLRNSDIFLDILTEKKLVALSLKKIFPSREISEEGISLLLANFLKANPQLKKLSLTDFKLYASCPALVNALMTHPGLEELVLENNFLSGQKNIDDLFVAAVSMPKLKTLHFVQSNAPSNDVLETLSKENKIIKALETLRIRCPITWFQTFGEHLCGLKKLELFCYQPDKQQDASKQNTSFVVQVNEVLKTHTLLTSLKISFDARRGAMIVDESSDKLSSVNCLMTSVQNHPKLQAFTFPMFGANFSLEEKNFFESTWMNILNDNTKLVSLSYAGIISEAIKNRLMRNKLLIDLYSLPSEETKELLAYLCACLPGEPTEIIVLLVKHLIYLETEEAFRTIEQYND